MACRPTPPPLPAHPACPQAATSAPLIERSIERATGIVYNITGGKDLTLQARFRGLFFMFYDL